MSKIGRFHHINAVLGDPVAALPLTAAFLTGVSFHLFREQVERHLSRVNATVCGAVAIALMASGPHVAEAGVIAFGAVTLYWAVYFADFGRLQRVNDSWDISYGVYLYGWPVATAVRWYDRSISPGILAASTLPIAMLCGLASWVLIERWSKDMFRHGGANRQRLAA